MQNYNYGYFKTENAQVNVSICAACGQCVHLNSYLHDNCLFMQTKN